WKLIQRYEDGRLHLFDLAKDPGETRDLASEEPERTKSMTSMLHAWLRGHDARFLRRKPDGPSAWQLPTLTASNDSTTRHCGGQTSRDL
ncbi:MAG: hypothetical protein KDC95_22745, partial [Planctomycetes bacterium]|nr:hypothetical protein [Planctomycetota bacterium]